MWDEPPEESAPAAAGNPPAGRSPALACSPTVTAQPAAAVSEKRRLPPTSSSMPAVVSLSARRPVVAADSWRTARQTRPVTAPTCKASGAGRSGGAAQVGRLGEVAAHHSLDSMFMRVSVCLKGRPGRAARSRAQPNNPRGLARQRAPEAARSLATHGRRRLGAGSAASCRTHLQSPREHQLVGAPRQAQAHARRLQRAHHPAVLAADGW